jgi:hypothetical protein
VPTPGFRTWAAPSYDRRMSLDGRYRWVDGWAQLPADADAGGWMHTDVFVAGDEIAVGHPGRPELLFLDRAGTPQRALPLPGLLELHAFRPAGDGLLWVVDNGTKFHVRGGEVEPVRAPEGAVALVHPERGIVRRLPRPQHDAYTEARYAPTSVEVDVTTGRVWVADGYGASLVHAFDAGGEHVLTLTGEAGAGRFDCPHGLLIVRRRGVEELYVADRANGRLQVHDLDGTFLRAVGAGELIAPTVLAQVGDELVLTDFLGARLTVLDADDRVLGHLFANPAAPGGGPWPDAWPNARDADGAVVRPPLAPGVLNSPHAVAADGDGNLYVTEWLLGGRVTKLERSA